MIGSIIVSFGALWVPQFRLGNKDAEAATPLQAEIDRWRSRLLKIGEGDTVAQILVTK